MYFIAMACLMGDLYLQTFSALPSTLFLFTLLIISGLISAILSRYVRYYYLPFIFVFTIVWSAWYANELLSWSLPNQFEGKSIWVTGYIASLPVQEAFGSRFEFAIDTIKETHIQSQLGAAKVRLVWHGAEQPLRVGDHYQLLVRLKRIHAPQNPGTFDFEAWALQKRIRAIGYVVTHTHNQLLSHHWYHYPIDQIRQAFQDNIRRYSPSSRTAPWLMALIIGERNGISPEDWQVLRNTGTNHLMAIGGLHIGILAGLIYVFFSWWWRLIPTLPLYFPAKQAGACAALITAFIYSLLAGFSIPTQRANLMLTVFMFALLSRRQINVWQSWSLAMVIVILINPLDVMTESFWLSFGTLALIIYGMSGRLAPNGYWWKWGRMQWVVGIGLLPLTLALFQECTFMSFIANSLAIPWMEFFILPCCFLSSIFLFLSPSLAHCLLWIADQSLSGLWNLLTWLSHFQFLTWQSAMPNSTILILTLLGLLLLLVPAGFPGRWLGIIWLLPLIYYQPTMPALGDIKMTLLDVGQGLSVIVQTKNHYLVYDAGPKYADTLNAGDSIIIPYLRSIGVNHIDMLVISHGDSDHIGGAQSLIHALPVITIKTSVPDKFNELAKASYCLRGQTWNWDHVQFEFISPPDNNFNQGNDSSCVLRIDNGQQSILLPGDIEKKAEHYLLTHSLDNLRSDILIAPHHGSKTSGLPKFISATHPHYVLYAVGYRNHYHFPHATVVQNYRKINAIQFNTANHGAIYFEVKKNQPILPTDLYRLSHKRYWMD